MQLLLPQQYQSNAQLVFLEISEAVRRVLPQARIEHVGSSSIPGSISKGDINICVVVETSQHQKSVEELSKIGYQIKTNTLRTPELCMLESPREDVDIALQVIAEGSEFEFFITFRDILRSNSSLVEKYNDLKVLYQSHSEDRYREEKSKFIAAVLSGA